MSIHKNIMMGILRGQPYPHEKGINLTGHRSAPFQVVIQAPSCLEIFASIFSEFL